VHIILASFFHAPRIALTKDEADQFGAATARVMQLYDLEIMSEEARAWWALSVVVSTIYGTRISSALIDAKKSKRKGPAVVVEMPGGPPPAAGNPSGDDSGILGGA
jgi:hypothetical protein